MFCQKYLQMGLHINYVLCLVLTTYVSLLCQQVSFGEMIGCDNEEVISSWLVHMSSCVCVYVFFSVIHIHLYKYTYQPFEGLLHIHRRCLFHVPSAHVCTQV